ncbi:MAG TPA: DUF3108 domain-containing protein [Planctomycetota bacterium]|nr:DUF3108 domain-containing protein [Planctomycetota bacterium]
MWTALTLVLSACGPAIRAQSPPLAEVRDDPGYDAPVEPAAMAEPEQAAPVAEAAQPNESQQAAPSTKVEARESKNEAAEQAAPAQQSESGAQAPTSASTALTGAKPELWTLERGAGEVPLTIPRHETLTYAVHVNLGWLGNPAVGRVTLTSNVRPFYSATPGQSVGEQALLSGRADGSYQVYTLDNTISSALLPQAWPRTIHRNVQTGTESRSREIMLGVIDGKESSRYRSDGHCKGCKDKAHFVSGSWPWQDDAHCKKCKRPEHRVWKEPKAREIPAGTLDMLTAVYLARSLVIDGRERVEFPLIDRTDLWQVQLSRGRHKLVETEAGKFDAVQVELRTGPPEGTPAGESTKFEGLFGIHGTISIWMDAISGVPVQIEGQVPAGPVDLDVTIILVKASGTPSSFTPLRQ